MNTIDPSSTAASQIQNSDATLQRTNNETLTNENTGEGADLITDAQFSEAAEQIAMATAQTSLMLMFPEARRIQQRAESFNKQMLAD